MPNIMLKIATWMASLDKQLKAMEPKYEERETSSFESQYTAGSFSYFNWTLKYICLWKQGASGNKVSLSESPFFLVLS